MDKQSFREGFRILQPTIEIPPDYVGLHPDLQTNLLICHLYVNSGRSIEEIELVGLDRRRIVRALLDHGIIEDRRRNEFSTNQPKLNFRQ